MYFHFASPVELEGRRIFGLAYTLMGFYMVVQ